MTSIKPYRDAGKLVTFDHDGEVVAGFYAYATPGHTAGHTAYVLDSHGKRLAFLGDLIHVAGVQLASPRVTVGFDSDEKLAYQSRQDAFAKLSREGVLVTSSHFNFPALGYLRAADKGWQWIWADYDSRVE